MSLGEFELIERYFSRQGRGHGLTLGIGDDCALISGGSRYLSACASWRHAKSHSEQSIATVEADGDLAATELFTAARARLEQLGGEPHWAFLALTMPGHNERFLESFAASLMHSLRHADCALAGGDTTRGPLSADLFLIGTPKLQRSELAEFGASLHDPMKHTSHDD